MSEYSRLLSLYDILSCLKDAESYFKRGVGLRTVKQNLQYVIDDVEQEIKLIREKSDGL